MMEKKVRLIIFGLIGLTVITIIYAFSISAQKEALVKRHQSEKETLARENELLAQKASAFMEDKKKAENRTEELKREIDKILNEQEALKSKYDILNQERDALAEKLKSRSVPVESKAISPVVAPQTEDSYWAELLKQKAALEISGENFKEQLNQMKLLIAELKRDKSNLEVEISSIKQDREDLSRRLNYNEKLLDSLSAELVREKNDKSKILEELKTIRNEYLLRTRQLRALAEEKVVLESKLQQTEQGRAVMQKRLDETNVLLERKTLENEDKRQGIDAFSEGKEETGVAKGSVELPPIVVRSEESEVADYIPAAPSEGKVLAVNREHNFIVVDLGEVQGIVKGKIFSVMRDGKKIATVEVIQTRKDVSACDIRQQDTTIKVGDSLR